MASKQIHYLADWWKYCRLYYRRCHRDCYKISAEWSFDPEHVQPVSGCVVMIIQHPWFKWDASRGRYILPVVHIYIYHDNTLAASASISNFLFNFKHHYCVSKFSTDSVSSSIIIPNWASDRPSTAEYKHTRTCRIIKFSYWTLYLTFWRKILLFINLSLASIYPNNW